MKTLYVSDLDGTLFNKSKKLSEYSVKIINRCIDDGMLFTVATARMPYGCDYRLKELHLKTPGILTNGVFLYDFKEEKVISAESIDGSTAMKVTEIFQANELSCFVYTYDSDGIHIFFGSEELKGQTQYYSGQALKKCAEVCKVDDFADAIDRNKVVYIAYTGSKEQLKPICKQLDEIQEINYSFYLNIYNGLYCLEIYSVNASKQNALIKLKEMVQCDETVVFGDNYNDVPMITIADRSYAPENALPEIKEMVNAVISDCNEDGVAKFLEKERL